MAPGDNGGTLDVGELKAALDAGELPHVVEQLVAERGWVELRAVLGFLARTARLQDVMAVGEALQTSLDRLGDLRRARATTVDAVASLRLAAGQALLARAGAEPTTELEVDATRLGAALLHAAGETRRAARAFERIGDGATAAELWGELGELEAMEAALAREEARRDALRLARDAVQRARSMLDAGQRLDAAAVAATVAEGTPETAAARALAAIVEQRLVRGGGVTLRTGHRSLRLAGVPAVLGRDAGCAVPLRDPGVSRRHAVLRLLEGEVCVEDAGSRGGTRLSGVPLEGIVPLRGEGELGLGAGCLLSFRELGPGRVELHGLCGLDRELHALVGAESLPLAPLLCPWQGVVVAIAPEAIRLLRPVGVQVRLAGQLVGAVTELLHGDVLEVAGSGAPPTRIEVL